MPNHYGYTKQVSLSYEQAITKVKEELQKQSFGVLTEIDVSSTLHTKLNVDMDNYVILGACHPLSAYQALQVEPDIGLMLPCNVIVYEKDGQVFISTILPTVGMSMIDNNSLQEIAQSIEKSLIEVIDKV